MKLGILAILLASLAAHAAQKPPTDNNAYCSNDIWIGAVADGAASLPIHCVSTDPQNTPSNGQQILVPAGADVTSYLRGAQCGDTLLLNPGAYVPFTLLAKGCDAQHWINIRSAASGLPPRGTRLTPCEAGIPALPGRPSYACRYPSNKMATISTKPGPDIQTQAGASYYRIGPGIELTRPNTAGISYDLVTLQGSDHIIFDRVWVHGTEIAAETKNGFNLTGATNLAIINSYLNDFKCIAGKGGACTDAHAVDGGDDPGSATEGTWKIVNNFIEASGENIMFGGSARGTATPEDIEIRLNHLYKVPSWNPNSPDYVSPYPGFKGYIAKNLFELKNAGRVLFEGNRLEYSWGGYSQDGFAVVLTPRGTWASVDDVTIRQNYISHVGNGFQLAATRSCSLGPTVCKSAKAVWEDSGGAARWSIHDILVDDINAAYYRGSGTMAEVASGFATNPPLGDVQLDHLTFVTDGSEGVILSLGANAINVQPKMGAFALTNSIVRAGKFNGIWSIGSYPCAVDEHPTLTFNQCFTQWGVTDNLVVGWGAVHPAATWPAGNQTPGDYTGVFVNPLLSGGDYHVLPPYKGVASDGADLGANIDTINALMTRAN
jgi:hypothetical protein